jgi:hypothetical protein
MASNPLSVDRPFEHTKKEGKTIKSQIRHPSSTDVKKLLPLRPAGTLTCGKPDILKTVYEGAQGIEEKVKAVIALLGGKGDGAYRVLLQSECLIADATDKDQHIHQDGQPTGSSPVIAVNILLYSEMGDDVKFNIVPKSHIVMNRLRRQELTLSSESKSLGHCEGFDYDGCGLLDSLRVEQVVYTPGYPMLSIENAFHGGVSTRGARVLKYHCLLVQDGSLPNVAFLNKSSTDLASALEDRLNANEAAPESAASDEDAQLRHLVW